MNTLVKKFLLLISIIILFNSCAAINVTTSSAKEKGIKEAISDGMIDAAINKEFINHDINMFINVEIEVVEGRVLLTGSVKKMKHRMDAVKLAWKALGVREVINEIDVTDKGGITKYLTDVKIKAKIRYKIIADKEIASINYNFESVNIEVPPTNFDFDLSCNIAMVLGKQIKENPKNLAFIKLNSSSIFKSNLIISLVLFSLIIS